MKGLVAVLAVVALGSAVVAMREYRERVILQERVQMKLSLPPPAPTAWPSAERCPPMYAGRALSRFVYSERDTDESALVCFYQFPARKEKQS